MLFIQHEKLRETGRTILEAAGAPADIAEIVTNILVDSNLVGHDSHGVLRIPTYVNQIKQGDIDPDARPTILEQTASTALIAGNYAFGHYAAHFATNVVIEKAKAEKLAAAGIVQCNHIGRVGEYASQAARQGVLAMVTSAGVGGTGIAAPFGGAGRALGTNPIAFGVPDGEHAPMVVDFATTVIAEGKIQVARSKGEQLPPGCILDKDGNPSTSPADFYSGGMLLPFGGHKGYSMALVVQALSTALIGVDAYGRDGRGSGTFVLGIDAGAFRPADAYGAATDSLFDRVKSVPPAPGFNEVLIPGEPEERTRAKRLAEGVPVPETIHTQLIETAQSLGASVERILAV